MHALKKYVYRNKTFEMSQDYQKELGNAYKKKNCLREIKLYLLYSVLFDQSLNWGFTNRVTQHFISHRFMEVKLMYVLFKNISK